VTRHRETRHVPYSADRMYAIVADVAAYPKFLPWVTELAILSRESVKGREVLNARMSVGFSRFKESYVSRVVLDPQNRTVDVVQMEGPFRKLENHWRFVPDGEGCRIAFEIDFEFRNPLLNAVAGQAFGLVLLRMQDSFLERARALSKSRLS